MRPRRGMTLIEILFVVSVIAVLASILFPVFARARERARQGSCLGNLVNIGFALHMYAEDHARRFPPTEDDLSPLVDRYVRQSKVFICPSSGEGSDVPMGAPANPSLFGRYTETPPPLATSYYHRAGRRPYETPSPALLSDQSPLHSEHANVLYADGHAASLAESPWRGLGFRPLDELRPPETPARGPGGMGVPPGGGLPGMPGGSP